MWRYSGCGLSLQTSHTSLAMNGEEAVEEDVDTGRELVETFCDLGESLITCVMDAETRQDFVYGSDLETSVAQLLEYGLYLFQYVPGAMDASFQEVNFLFYYMCYCRIIYSHRSTRGHILGHQTLTEIIFHACGVPPRNYACYTVSSFHKLGKGLIAPCTRQ